jgi:uncharacterized damage-inducible protein DinB
MARDGENGMEFESRERLIIEPLPGYEPEIGLLLAVMDEGRQRTKQALAGLSEGALNATPGPGGNSIGTILYHLAAIEADWLYSEILEQPFPPDAAALFPRNVRDDEGRLTTIETEDLDSLIARLDAVRVLLRDGLRGMSLQEFRRVRVLPDYDVTPDYVLHHLMQHEAEHRGEIAMLRVLTRWDA